MSCSSSSSERAEPGRHLAATGRVRAELRERRYADGEHSNRNRACEDGLGRGQLMMRCTDTYEQMSAEFGVSTKIRIPKAASISVDTVLMVMDVAKGQCMMRRRTTDVHMRQSGDLETASQILSVCVRELLAPELLFLGKSVRAPHWPQANRIEPSKVCRSAQLGRNWRLDN